MTYKLIIIVGAHKGRVLCVESEKEYELLSFHGNPYFEYDDSEQALNIVDFIKDIYNIDSFSECDFRITVIDCGCGRGIILKFANLLSECVEINVVSLPFVLPWILQHKQALSANKTYTVDCLDNRFSVICGEDFSVSVEKTGNDADDTITVVDADFALICFPRFVEKVIETVVAEPTEQDIQKLEEKIREKLEEEYRQKEQNRIRLVEALKALESKKREASRKDPAVLRITAGLPKKQQRIGTPLWGIFSALDNTKLNPGMAIRVIHHEVPDGARVIEGQILGFQINRFCGYYTYSNARNRDRSQEWEHSRIPILAPYDGRVFWVETEQDAEYTIVNSEYPVAVVCEYDETKGSAFSWCVNHSINIGGLNKMKL